MAWISKRPVGVVRKEPCQTGMGYTLFCVDYGHYANLMDPDGRIVHRWHHPDGIQHARMMPDGNLLVATHAPEDAGGAEKIGGSAEAIVELDWDSKVIWEYHDPMLHHDFVRAADGRTLAIAWEPLPAGLPRSVKGGVEPEGGARMLGDVVLEIDQSGALVNTWHSWEHLDPDIDRICPLEVRKEWTHCNSIEILDDGRWLLSFRLTSTIAIVQPSTGDIEWRWGPGEISHQHAASPLLNDNILIFDNGSHRVGKPSYSRLIELDPASGEIAWRYESSIILSFYSFMGGGASRLDNGNTLVTECATGRIFEVTPPGDVVWEFVSPFSFVHPHYGPTPSVFRAFRLPTDDPRLRGRELDAGRWAINARIGGTCELPCGVED